MTRSRGYWSVWTLFSVFWLLPLIAPPTETLPPASQPEVFQSCGFDPIKDELAAQQHPFWQQQQLLDKAYAKKVKAQGFSSEKSLDSVCVVPVVVHIIHNNGPENIPDAQIEQAMQDLNDAFANVGYYDPSTGVDVGIRFCLAKQDPDGNPTNGITRDVSPLTDMDSDTDDLAVKDLNRWDPTCYANIWVVNEISNNNGTGIAGYAYYPSAHGSDVDGIVCEASFFGSSQSASGVHIHEFGHYFGLLHTFEDGCLNDDCTLDGDRVCDTPPDDSTDGVPCDMPPNSCSTDTDSGLATDQNDLINNYMDYGFLACYNMFSAGQRDRMLNFLTTTRQSLLSCSGCIDPCPVNVVADFTVSDTIVDVNSTVQLTNISQNANGYTWQIDGVPFSNAQDTSYLFDQLGTYTIQLVSTNDANEVCIDSVAVEIEVFCPLEVGFSLSNNQPAVGEEVFFTNTSQFADDFVWTVDGQNVSTEVNAGNIFAFSGIYTVCLEASSAYCNATDCLNVLVGAAGSPCEAAQLLHLGEIGVTEWANELLPVPEGFIRAGRDGDMAFLELLDPDLNTLWHRNWDFTNGPDYINHISLDAQGTLLGVGRNNPIGFATNFAFRYDYQNHQMIWQRLLEEPEQSRFEQILELPNGNIGIFGTFALQGAPGNSYDLLFMEVDPASGASLEQQVKSLGTTDTYQHVAIHNDEVFVTGMIRYTAQLNSIRPVLSKFDAAGNHLWTRTYIEPGSGSARLYGKRLLVQNDSLLLFTRGSLNDANLDNASLQLSILDVDGQILNSWDYSVANTGQTMVRDVMKVNDGYVIVANHEYQAFQSVFLLKLHLDFSLAWAKNIGTFGDQVPFSVESQGTSILIHGRHELFFENDEQILFARLDAQGNVETATGCSWILPLTVTQNELPAFEEVPSIVEYTTAYPFDLINILSTPGDLFPTAIICTEPCEEICDNGIDDDGDGLIDCCDPDLQDSLCCQNLPVLDLPDTLGICAGDLIILDAGPGFVNYDWGGTGVDGPFFFVSQAGIYHVTVHTGCEQLSDTVLVEQYPEVGISLPPDQVICSGDAPVTASVNGFDSVQWLPDLLVDCATCPNVTFLADETTMYYVTGFTAEGCEEQDSILITILPTHSFSDTLVICEGESLELYGQTITGSGVYSMTYSTNTNPACDSTSTTTVIAVDSVVTQEQIQICAGESAMIFGNEETASGTFSESYVAANGCDSIHLVTLTVQDTFFIEESIAICEGEVATIFGQPEDQPGTYAMNFTSADGCDSMHVVHLEVFPAFDILEEISICEGESVSIFGQMETEAGVYAQLFTTAGGCDSTHTVILEVLPELETSEYIALCEGETTIVFGDEVGNSGSFTESYLTIFGCDSTHTVEVAVFPTYSTFESIVICEGEVADVFGSPQGQAGDYSMNFSSVNACDSLHTISLQLLSNIATEDFLEICEGESIAVFGNPVTQAGVYTESFVAANGCDSIHTITLSVLDAPFTQETMTICAGESATIFGQPESVAGNYEAVFPLANGCDSTHQIELIVLSNQQTSETINICQGETIDIFGQEESEPGTYFMTFTAANGCDSTHTILLGQLPTFSVQETRTICEGDSTLIFGDIQTNPGVFIETFTASNGCDSIHQVELKVLPDVSVFEAWTICDGETIKIFGNQESEPGIYTETYTAANGCDSVHTIELSVLGEILIDYTADNACFGQDDGAVQLTVEGGAAPYHYFWNFPAPDTAALDGLAAGVYSVTVTDANFCQNFIALEVPESVMPDFSIEVFDVACYNEANGMILLDSEENLQFGLSPFELDTLDLFEDLPAGLVSIFIQNEDGCLYEEQLLIQQPLPIHVFLPESLELDLGDTIQIVPQGNLPDAATYSWSPPSGLSCTQCPAPLTFTTEDIRYTLEVLDESGCATELQISVWVDKEVDLYIPNAFSPDFDGVNDFFRFFTANPSIWIEEVLIFDRWGELLYQQADLPADAWRGWDGTFRGRQVDTGVYVYLIRLRFPDGEQHRFTGDVLLLR